MVRREPRAPSGVLDDLLDQTARQKAEPQHVANVHTSEPLPAEPKGKAEAGSNQHPQETAGMKSWSGSCYARAIQRCQQTL